jgi:hypothetical protein
MTIAIELNDPNIEYPSSDGEPVAETIEQKSGVRS